MEKFRVTFYPDKKSVEVPKDTNILSAAVSAGAYIKSSCGGDGVCGQCKVILKKGDVITQPSGMISVEERRKNFYLACLTEIRSNLEVEIPSGSKLDFEKPSPQDLELRLKGAYSKPEEVEFLLPEEKVEPYEHSPLVTKLYLELPKPDLNDKISDLERINRQIKRLNPSIPTTGSSLANIRFLGDLLRDSDWKITVVLSKKNESVEILYLLPGEASKNNFGMAFDIGTTTISGQLIDLDSGKILGTKAAYNKQASFGSDVITRIIYAREAEGLEKLHLAVIDEMNEMIQELIKEHKIDLNDLNCVVCAGNTTMMHLLLRIDPTHIRKEPYVPTANFLPFIRAGEVEVKINSHGILACVPGVSSYVGGDITSGVLSSGIDKERDLCLLIDIGTNGEIVLGNREFLISSAASAGPAFEGSGVSCGMRASSGAIQNVKINPKDFSLTYSIIGEAKARGICGSGYIDLISEMLRVGLIDKLGLFKIESCKRIRQGKFGKEFVIIDKKDSGTNSDIFIAEADIENIKRAKAAIYAAAAILVKHMGLSFNDLKKVFIAGGFGTYLDMEKAIAIGLLPDLDKSCFHFIGNSSLAGARQMLLSSNAMKRGCEIAQKMDYLELSVEPAYMDEYIAALFFPHTDLTRFPSVRI